MKKNIGSIDKNVRLIAGVIILILGYVYESWWGLIGIIPLLTGLTGVCLLYTPFKISTKRKE